MTREPERALDPVFPLTAQWRRSGAWLGAAWAVVCGIIASGSFSWNPSAIVMTLVAFIIAIGLWPTFWAALAETDWAAALGRWRNWREGKPVTPLPYTQPGSPADTLSRLLGQYRDWAARDLLPNYGSAVASVIFTPVIGLILSAVLGAPAILVCILAICLPQLAVVLCRGNGQPSSFLRGLMEITLPLLLGSILFRPLSLGTTLVAIGFGVVYAGITSAAASRATPKANVRLWNLGQALVLAYLLAERHSTGAFLFALLWLPQFLMQSRPAPRYAQWWLMAGMLVTAITLA